jgi:hypothetical protein
MNINNSNFLSYKNNYIKRLRTNLKGFLEPGDRFSSFFQNLTQYPGYVDLNFRFFSQTLSHTESVDKGSSPLGFVSA